MIMVRLWLHLKNRRKRRMPRSLWIRPHLTRRASHGHHMNIMRELAEDPLVHRNFIRLDAAFPIILLNEYDPTFRNQKHSAWRHLSLPYVLQ